MKAHANAVRNEAIRRLIDRHRPEFDRTYTALRRQNALPSESVEDVERRLEKHRNWVRRLENERKRLKAMEVA